MWRHPPKKHLSFFQAISNERPPLFFPLSMQPVFKNSRNFVDKKFLQEKNHCPRTHTQQPHLEQFKILTVKNKYTSCTAFVRHVRVYSHPSSQGKLRALRAKLRKLVYRKRPCHCHVDLATYNYFYLYIYIYIFFLIFFFSFRCQLMGGSKALFVCSCDPMTSFYFGQICVKFLSPKF